MTRSILRAKSLVLLSDLPRQQAFNWLAVREARRRLSFSASTAARAMFELIDAGYVSMSFVPAAPGADSAPGWYEFAVLPRPRA